ncbi:MAG: hypothetical protein HY782_02930 [Chloroflexi bacterium]|nr:hypothetical protein [Chloroflexota bacterium]
MKWFLVVLMLLASGCAASAAGLATPQVTPPPTASPVPLGRNAIFILDPRNGNVVTQILVVDPDERRVTQTYRTRYTPEIAFSLDGSRLYVADSYQSRVIRGEPHDVISVYDARTGDLLRDDVEIPKRLLYKGFPNPQPFTFLSRDGRRVFVGKYGDPDIHALRMTVLDAETFKTLAEYPRPECNLLPLRDGRVLCAGQSQLRTIDPLTGTASQVSASAPGLVAAVVASTRDWVYAVGTDATGATLVSVVDLSSSPPHLVAERVSLDSPPDSRAGFNHVALSRDESRLYVGFVDQAGSGLAGEIWAFDARTWARVGVFESADAAFHVAVSADGKQLYTVNPFENTLTIFDTTTFRVVTVMRDLGETPAQIVIPPAR